MTDTIRELILRVLDYVERTSGASFEVQRLKSKYVDEDTMLFCFYYHDRDGELQCISRNGREFWSQLAELDEDNLRYLLEQLEGENDSI